MKKKWEIKNKKWEKNTYNIYKWESYTSGELTRKKGKKLLKCWRFVGMRFYFFGNQCESKEAKRDDNVLKGHEKRIKNERIMQRTYVYI